MENIPFGSSDDEEKKPLNIFESINDDDDKDEESKTKKNKKSSKTKRNVFFSKESTEYEHKDKKEEKPSIFGDGKESIFSGLLNRKDEAELAEEKHTEPGVEKSAEDIQIDQIQEEFQEVVDDRLKNAESMDPSSSGVEADELSANATFLSSVGERMAEGLPPTEAIEEAKTETVADMSTTEPDIVSDLPVSESFETVPIAPLEEKIPETRPPIEVIPPTLTPLEDIPVPEVALPVHPIATAPDLAPRSVETSSPRPDVTPESPGISRMNSLYYRDGRRGGLLMGGALGYLFGRRRGRIKTEAKLEPVITKKEKEINKLQGDLDRNEEEVRKAVSEQPTNASENIPAHTLEERRQEQHEREEKFAEALTDETMVTKAESTVEKNLVHTVAPQHNVEKAGDIKTEETTIAREAEKKAEVITMTIPELLVVADKIHIESTSLKQLYETRQIDAVNLRRVVKEYVSGGNHNKLLRQSLEAVELQQELRNEVKFVDETKIENSREISQDTYRNTPKGDATIPVGTNSLAQSTAVAESADQPATSQKTQSPQQDLLDHTSTNKGTSASVNMAIIGGIVVGVILMAAVLFYNSGS